MKKPKDNHKKMSLFVWPSKVQLLSFQTVHLNRRFQWPFTCIKKLNYLHMLMAPRILELLGQKDKWNLGWEMNFRLLMDVLWKRWNLCGILIPCTPIKLIFLVLDLSLVGIFLSVILELSYFDSNTSGIGFACVQAIFCAPATSRGIIPWQECTLGLPPYPRKVEVMCT